LKFFNPSGVVSYFATSTKNTGYIDHELIDT
jgi:hypothetical protein